MSAQPSVLLRRHLLDRGRFLGHLATGVGGIALGASLDYTVNGKSPTKAITRQVFVPPGTVCH